MPSSFITFILLSNNLLGMQEERPARQIFILEVAGFAPRAA
jgi:hypothetical protein